MNPIFTSDALRTVASIAVALLLSTTFVVAAVGPAQAAAPAVASVAAPLAY